MIVHSTKIARYIIRPNTAITGRLQFIWRNLGLWPYANNVTLDFSRPGKPTDNAFIEASNSKLREKCLNAHWFMNLDDAAQKLEKWRRHYNYERPHSAIGNIPPAQMQKFPVGLAQQETSDGQNSS